MDRQSARATFERYVSAYDPKNPRIALKIAHTYRVAELCARIAKGTGASVIDIDLAWLLGLLHDIGRFEQVRRYDTFNDAASISHAELGVSVLFDEGAGESPLIRSFVEDGCNDELMRTAIGTHSAYRISEGLPERTRTMCEILRDADKIDILRVNCVCPIEDIYGVSERDMRESALSPACIRTFYQHRCLPRGLREHPADILLGHVCFAWELVFPESLDIVREQGHLHQMLSRSWALPATQQAFDEMAAHMHEQLGL